MTAQYNPKHLYCCCLSARTGVFINSTLAGLISGLVAAVQWISLFNPKVLSFSCNAGGNVAIVNACLAVKDMSTIWKALTISMAILHTAYAVISIVGFVAACRRDRTLASAYSNILVFHFVLSLGFSIWYLVELFRRSTIGAEPLANYIALVVRLVFWGIEISGCMAAYRFLRSIDFEREIDAAASYVPKISVYGEKPISRWDSTP
ncbi:hypothetical protein PUNSTDRAFT_118518 [Punctularia strigosozonata HHB-11173 SS5]|uniref:uncharacterized protein n=1 Tax=Punctularia strigosozonata (strain HHB-11173) TaxID=741275 RepID=UPI00044170FC|nr:uncharacterized protein PUNSTDRAFT_118518 [Punctularia strigosozonata HHB-11173 SS5]EIN12831.1 hypothetical protein PUNSTDRAFT_118518 [Punctularia strigosozonata HHB-11173 SS5]